MASSFYVLMQKRSDGKVFSDLAKTTEMMYLFKEDAEKALKDMGQLQQHFMVVEMVAMIDSEYRSFYNEKIS